MMRSSSDRRGHSTGLFPSPYSNDHNDEEQVVFSGNVTRSGRATVEPSTLSLDRRMDNFHDGRNKRRLLTGVGLCCTLFLVILTISLVISRSVGDEPRQESKMEQQYKAWIVDTWKVTDLTTLRDSSSAPSRALKWMVEQAEDEPQSGFDILDEDSMRVRYALATFFFSTTEMEDMDVNSDTLDASPWKMDDNWMSPHSVCVWYGVDCFDGHPVAHQVNNVPIVQSLNLTGNQLQGTIPPELVLLAEDGDWKTFDVSGNSIRSLNWAASLAERLTPNMKHFYLSNNPLQSTIPEVLYEITSLSQVHLDRCQLTGSIDAAGLSKWKSSLQGLAMYDNQLTGSIPDTLVALTQLRVLYLDHNELTGSIPSTIGNTMTRLVDIRIGSSKLSGSLPTSMALMKNLQVFYAARCQLSGPVDAIWKASSRALPRLREFHVHQNQLTGSVPRFRSSEYLSSVYLDGNRLTGSLPAGFGNMTYMESLYLFQNELTGTLPKDFLDQMPSLTTLRLEGNQFQGSLPAEWFIASGQQHPLESLTLANNSLSGSIPSLVISTHMHHLQYLWLQSNPQLDPATEWAPALCEKTEDDAQWTELLIDCANNEAACPCCKYCF